MSNPMTHSVKTSMQPKAQVDRVTSLLYITTVPSAVAVCDDVLVGPEHAQTTCQMTVHQATADG